MTAINISFSEGSNKISIEEGAFDKQTSLTLVGKNASNYAVPMAENFLHLLENFSSRTPPANPITGQLWYDNNPSVRSLKVYSGTNWNPAGSVKKAATAPEETVSTVGDLWVNPVTRQLFMYSGATWDLIGPQFSGGTQTGPQVETFRDINEVDHTVLSIYANNVKIAIISAEKFTPKIYNLGFAQINKGINLSTNNVVNNDNKLWGVADSASALTLSTGEYVEANNFLRGDVISTSNASLNVKNNDGISVGSELSLKISTALDNSIDFTSKTNKSIAFNFYNTTTGNATVGMYLDPSFKVGIGQDNYAPSATLDVLGTAKITGNVTVTSTDDATSTTPGSISTAGGLSVSKNARFGSSAIFQNTVTLHKSTEGEVLVPNYTSDQDEATLLSIQNLTTPIFDIGTSTRTFRNVYASSFNGGTFNGSFSGTFRGDIAGSAASLQVSRPFALAGDITCDPVLFNGTAPVTLTTTISPNFISSKPKATNSLDTDQILTFRTSTGVQRTSKSLFLESVPAVPVGAIFPFAGISVPNGYLLCDGSEVPVSVYGALFTAIRYTYRNQASLIGAGTFAIPDLRGRFPLGRDNMDNDLTVTTPSGTVANAGGNRNGTGSQSNDPAFRVNGISASQIGGSSGKEAIGDQSVIGVTGNNVALETTGPVISIMNPYQTINYIIFTGVLS